LYSIGWTIFRLVELIAPLGFDVGVLRFGARHLDGDVRLFKGVVSQSLLASFLFGLTLGVSLFLLAPLAANRLFHKPDLVPVLRLLAVGFPFAALLAVVGSALRLPQSVGYSVMVQDLGQPLLALILLGIFYLFSLRLTGVLLSDIVSYGICAVTGLYLLGRVFPPVFNPAVSGQAMTAEMWRFSAVSSLVAFFSTLIFWTDRLFVGRFLSAADTGIYQAASQLSVIFAVVLGSLNRIVIPMFANLLPKGDGRPIQEVFRLSTKWGIYLCAPVLIVLWIAPGLVLSSLYGAAYGRGATVLSVLLLGQVFNLATGPVGPLLILAGHQNLVLLLSSVALTLNIALLRLLIPPYGLLGAGIATSIALGAFFGAALLVARWKLGMWPYDRRNFKGLAAIGIAAGSVLFLHGRLGSQPSLSLLSFEAGLAIVVFALGLLSLKLDQEDQEVIRVLLRRLAPRA
jgi:O-antigen/teichoic acid export membrane protein